MSLAAPASPRRIRPGASASAAPSTSRRQGARSFATASSRATPRTVDDYPAYNLFVRREALEHVGGWGTTFYGGEDTVLCLKLAEAGWPGPLRPGRGRLPPPTADLRATPAARSRTSAATAATSSARSPRPRGARSMRCPPSRRPRSPLAAVLFLKRQPAHRRARLPSAGLRAGRGRDASAPSAKRRARHAGRRCGAPPRLRHRVPPRTLSEARSTR